MTTIYHAAIMRTPNGKVAPCIVVTTVSDRIRERLVHVFEDSGAMRCALMMIHMATKPERWRVEGVDE